MNAQLNVVMLAAGQGKLARTRGMSARLIVVVENGADEVRRPFAGRPELTWV